MSENENPNKIVAGLYEVEIFDDGYRGYFEHTKLGEDRAGGLWFERNAEGKFSLTDYDGVCELPLPVVVGLRQMDIVVDDEFHPFPTVDGDVRLEKAE